MELWKGIALELEDVLRSLRPQTKKPDVVLWRGVCDELRKQMRQHQETTTTTNTTRPSTLGKRRAPEQPSTTAPDPKRRKVQKKTEDLREQARNKGFSGEEISLFEQPHHVLGDQLGSVSEVSHLCELGSETEWWAKNSRKMSVRKVEDKLARRKKEAPAPLPTPTPMEVEDSEEEGEEEEAEPEAEVVGTVKMVGQASHLYAGSNEELNKVQSRTVMELARTDISQAISTLVRPSDSKMNILTRYFLSHTQPRKNYKIRVVMQDQTTGETQQIVRSVPYFLDSLAPGGGGSGSGSGGDQAPDVHLHTRSWEEAWLLRSPIQEWGERPCVMGKQCQGHSYCFDSRTELREYVSPEEHAHWMTFGKWPHLASPERQCLMCKRNGVAMNYWSSRAARRPANQKNQLLVEFYNLVNVPGEYHIGQCLWNQGPYMGLYGPVPWHHLPNYSTHRTTVGDLVGRGRLTPSVSLQLGVPESVMHRVPVVLFQQTGFMEERHLKQATDRARERELARLYFVSDRTSTTAPAAAGLHSSGSLIEPFSPLPSSEENVAAAIRQLVSDPIVVATLRLDASGGRYEWAEAAASASAGDFSAALKQAWLQSDPSKAHKSVGVGVGEQIPESMKSVLMQEDMGLVDDDEEGGGNDADALDGRDASDVARASAAADDETQALYSRTPDLSESANPGVPLPSTTTPAAAAATATPAAKKQRKSSSSSSSSSSSGGGANNGQPAVAPSDAPNILHTKITKLGSWLDPDSDMKTPQSIVWTYVQQAAPNSEEAEDKFPWWVRSSFREAMRPWLVPLRPGERNYVWLPDPLLLEMDGRLLIHYTIYATLVSRVHRLQLLYEELARAKAKAETPRHVLLQLALWIDTHQMLMLFIEESGLYRNQELREEIEEHDADPFLENNAPESSRLITWFDLYCPSLRLVMHQGELPDLSFLMPIIRYWNDVPREMAQTYEEDLRQFADLLSKSSPRPQQARSMNNICARNVLQYPRIAECFRRMVFCSLGGLYDYPECGTAISHLWVRHELYRWFCMHPASDDGLGTWLNGFVLDEIKDLIVNHGKKKRKKKVKLSPSLVPFDLPLSESLDEASNESSAATASDGQPSKILSGYNNEQVSQGYYNMTTFVQFVMNEYNYLMMSRLPSLDQTMQELHWHRVVQRIYLDGCDRMRHLMSQWFERGNSFERMMNEYSVDLFGEDNEEGAREFRRLGGREVLDELARHYTPWLRWDLQTEMADSIEPDDRGSRVFQAFGLAHGACGHLIWNQRHMTLLETMLFKCREYALYFCSRFMHRSFSETVVEETGRLHVKQTGQVQVQAQTKDGRWQSTYDVPECDRRFIDLVVQFFRERMDGQTPSYEWMSPIFGLDFYPLMMLRLSEHYYELEVFRQASVNVLQAMLETHPREFFYVQYLMQQIELGKQVAVYQLPRNVAMQQAQALRLRFESMTGFRLALDDCPEGEQLLPRLWDITYYCEQHLDLKHCLVDDYPYKGTQAGVINAVTDPATGHLWCSTNLLKANRTPKLHATAWIRRAGVVFDCDNRMHALDEKGDCTDGDPRKSMWSEWKKIPLSSSPPTAPSASSPSPSPSNLSGRGRCIFALYAEKTQKLSCQYNRQVKSMHLCGQALRLGTRIHVLCPRCAGHTLLQPEKFNNPQHGFLCPSCHEECEQEERARSKTASGTSLLYHCYLCPYDKWTPANKVHRMLLWDDMHAQRDGGGCRFRPVYFCERHLPPWLGTSVDASRLSTVALVAAKRLTALPVRDTPEAQKNSKMAKRWNFITNKSEQRFWKSFDRTSRRLARIYERSGGGSGSGGT